MREVFLQKNSCDKISGFARIIYLGRNNTKTTYPKLGRITLGSPFRCSKYTHCPCRSNLRKKLDNLEFFSVNMYLSDECSLDFTSL